MKRLELKRTNILNENVLTRDQLKGILGGISSDGSCNFGPCSVYDSSTSQTYNGYCGLESQGGGLYICECVTNLGEYIPNGGTSSCYSA